MKLSCAFVWLFFGSSTQQYSPPLIPTFAPSTEPKLTYENPLDSKLSSRKASATFLSELNLCSGFFSAPNPFGKHSIIAKAEIKAVNLLKCFIFLSLLSYAFKRPRYGLNIAKVFNCHNFYPVIIAAADKSVHRENFFVAFF